MIKTVDTVLKTRDMGALRPEYRRGL